MASADLRQELVCSICLNIYTDPVNLSCGHNFCRVCIDRGLDTQDGSGFYSCPECREKFQKRPVLQRNITLCNIVRSFLTSCPDQKETAIFCTHCIQSLVPAVKSCLHCEVSLCDNHLRVHPKSPEHVLCDPTTSLDSRKCPAHTKCCSTENAACICGSCSGAGQQGHQILEMLNQAAEKKKNKLKDLLKKLTKKSRDTEKRIQRLQMSRRKDKEKAEGVRGRVTFLFRDIKRQLEDLEKRVLDEISSQEECVSLSVSDLIQQLEIEKDELSRRMRQTEELCNTSDPMTVLQDPVDWCYIEALSTISYPADWTDTEERERNEEQAHSADDLDVGFISGKLQTLFDIITGIKKGIYKQTPQPFNISSHRNFTPYTEETYPGAPRIRTEQHPTDILLDLNTAGNYIDISNDQKTATKTCIQQNYPERAERFQDYQVMSSGGFSSGKHCFEVKIRGLHLWRVGMCYPSISRRGHFSFIGNNNKSWCLERGWWNNIGISVIHDSELIQLPNTFCSDRVRIYLDYEAGQLSFYSVCGPIRHLHTFSSTFTEPLHVALYLVGGSITISEVSGAENNLPRDSTGIGCIV